MASNVVITGESVLALRVRLVVRSAGVCGNGFTDSHSFNSRVVVPITAPKSTHFNSCLIFESDFHSYLYM